MVAVDVAQELAPRLVAEEGEESATSWWCGIHEADVAVRESNDDVTTTCRVNEGRCVHAVVVRGPRVASEVDLLYCGTRGERPYTERAAIRVKDDELGIG